MQSPESGLNELDLIVKAIPPVGNVLPVQIAVTNVMTRSLKLEVEAIRAGRADGSTVGVLSPDQAKEAAGGADKLIGALSQVYVVHREGRQKQPTRAESVAAGCLLPFSATGAGAGGGAFGAVWIMFVCPVIIVGGISKSVAVAASSSLQVDDIVLNGDLTSGVENQGYIFLPPGDYTTIEVPATDRGTGGLETIVQAWDSASQLATTVPVSPLKIETGTQPRK